MLTRAWIKLLRLFGRSNTLGELGTRTSTAKTLVYKYLAFLPRMQNFPFLLQPQKKAPANSFSLATRSLSHHSNIVASNDNKPNDITT